MIRTQAIEEFNAERNAKEARLVKLRTLVEKGGVKVGMPLYCVCMCVVSCVMS